MAVVGRILQYSGPSAKATRSGVEWKQIWQYELSDPLDGPQVILNHLETNGPWFLDPYVNGNDSDTFALVEEIEVSPHLAGSPQFWPVTISYKPLNGGSSPGSRPGGDGNYTEIPWYWSAEVSTSVQQVATPVDEAVYVGGFTHDPPRVKPGDIIPFTNSTLVEKFDPPLERDDAHGIIKIKSWHRTFDFDMMQVYLNAVNSRKMSFSDRALKGEFGAYTLRLVNVEMTEKRDILTFGGVKGRYKYHEVICELHYNPRGWRIDVIDRGTMRGALPHEPNGRGGLITYVTPKGGISAAKIVDADGLAVGTPVLLDGGGQPQDWSLLGVSVTRPPTVAPSPVRISWKMYGEYDLALFEPIARAMFSF